MQNKINDLIEEGNKYQFQNNCYSEEYGTYSRPSDEMQSWIACVEDFIIDNFGTNSAPYRLYKEFDKKCLYGNYQNEFDKQKSKLIAALKACLRIQPKTKIDNIKIDFILMAIFNRFHIVVKQLRNRHNSRPTIDVDDEYDVQDLLHGLLRLFFNDVRAEEWCPSYAGGSSRMDFLLKDEKIILEVKKTRKGLDDKELGKQLIEDKAKYQVHPDCKKLICFIYDPEGRIINPQGLINDLKSQNGAFEVTIIIKP